MVCTYTVLSHFLTAMILTNLISKTMNESIKGGMDIMDNLGMVLNVMK